MSSATSPSPDEELDRRLTRARQALAAQRLDALIVLAPDSQYWLCGLESFISGVLTQALVVSADEDRAPVLLVWDADAALARATATVGEVHEYRFGVDDPALAIRRTLRSHAPNATRVGFDAASRAVPYAFGQALIDALAPIRCVDASALVADLRLVKSARELEHLRRAGAFADVGLRAAVAHARPGVTERQVAAELEYAMRSAGADYPSIPTELTSGQRSVFVHGTPSHRRLEAGDLVHVEVGGVEHRYNAVALQTFVVPGADPDPVGARLYDVAQTCLSRGLAAVRPDVEARSVEAPALAVLADEKLGDGFRMRFGYGVGVGYPPTWLDPFQITRTSSQVLQVGIAFVLHACLLDEAASTGVVAGGTYAVTAEGVEQLAGAGPVDLQ